MSSFLGKSGSVGLQRAVNVIDTLGSGLISLQNGSRFTSNSALRWNKVSILAFEVANTIVKEAVKCLVSTDMTELLKIAAADIREEFNIFSREVCRFGDLCMDPQWHNLGRYLDFGLDIGTKKQPRKDAEMTMQELMTLTQYTSKLYHELHAMDRFEQNYKRKVSEAQSLHLSRRGEGTSKLLSKLKHQKKLVKRLQKNSLWSKSLEEVVEKLVDIVSFLHQHILEVFGDTVSGISSPEMKPERLGIAGLALHYAHMITQINNIASYPTSLLPSMKDELYNRLPDNVKKKLRSQLQQLCGVEKDLSIAQMKAQLEKTLRLACSGCCRDYQRAS